jgi:hypothetical protein
VDRLDLLAATSTLSGLIALAAAVFVYRTAPDLRVAWRFGGLLALEAIMVWTSPAGPFRWLEPEGLDRFWLRLHFANDGLLIATYLPAVAVSIRSRILLPFRPRRVVVSMIGLALINAICVFAIPDIYLGEGAPVAGPGPTFASAGPGIPVLFALLVISYLLGLLATLLARRSARAPLARRQATVLALAFGARDLTWGLVYALGFVAILLGGFAPAESLLIPLLMSGGLVLYVCLTAYGVASTHLFDIDLRVKWTLERGTVAALFVAVFFMVSEGAAAILSEQLGALIGILATGALVFAIAPLQRAAERLANQAMPSVQDTAEYKNYRKLQVYGEAVADAMRDSPITPVQRVVLNRLRQQLALDEEEAATLEQELGGREPAVQRA